MSKMKRCPACQKELPLLAVRCKHCGFKLANKAGDPSPANKPSTPPPPPMAKISVPKVPGRDTVPPGPASPPRPAAKANKKTMMLGVVAPPPSKPKPKGMGQSPSPKPGMRGPTKPLTPLARPSTPPPPPKPMELSSDNEDITDGLDWLPDTEDLTDESQLILLDEESETSDDATMDADELIEDENYSSLVEEASQAASNELSDDDEEKESSNFLFKYILPDETLDALEEKKFPLLLVKFLGKLQFLHTIIAGATLLALIVLIVVLCVSGPDKPETKTLAQVLGKQIGTTTTPIKPGVKSEGVKTPTTKPTAGTEKITEPATGASIPAKPVPAPGTNCKPLSDYPDFPWRNVLEKALKSVGTNTVCGLFGTSPSSVAGIYTDLPVVGPSGNDWIKGGGFVEVFATGKADRRGPVMEFLFVGDKLYEIRLAYRDTEGKDLSEKEIAAIFEEKPEKLKDGAGRRITRFIDGDMQVEIAEVKWYGRTLRTLVWRSSQVAESLANEFAEIEKNEALLASGESLFAKWKFDDAIKKLDELIESAPNLGVAYAKKALCLTRLEKFDQVKTVAGKLIETSSDDRMHAEAYGLLGVSALFEDNKDLAISYFKKANKADLANGFFSMSVKELETGEYATDRVALIAARMECLRKKKSTSTPKGLLARGNFPTMQLYFDILRKAKKDPKFNKLQKQYVKGECR